MSVLDILNSFGTETAIVLGDTGDALTYHELSEMVRSYSERISQLCEKTLVLLYTVTSSVESVAIYLACLELGYPVCLVEPREVVLRSLIETYSPGLILAPQDVVTGLTSLFSKSEFTVWEGQPFSLYSVFTLRNGVRSEELHRDLALLLLTSGSTGSPKLVRLQWKNIISNSTSISSILGIQSGERSIQSLPMCYSYGLSLVNSHLFNGGTVVLTAQSFLRPDFWQIVKETGCTSFAGVPYMYETLHRLRFDTGSQPTITTFTQAGGGLKRDLVEHFYTLTRENRQRLVVMYGQTEATARISFVPPDMLGRKAGSIGISIPGGALSVESLDGATELVYRGPNVMMGYSENRSSLSRGDDLEGVLRTGDIGTVDSDGYFSIIGRKKRITKLFGQRVDLHDVEREAERVSHLSVAAVDGDGAIRLFVASYDAGEEPRVNEKEIQKHIARFLQVPPNVVRVDRIDMIPLTSSGKRDYHALVNQI
jgi:acyl-CoA synthetase (AMP-forming)/AMP-acid ligase II